jgi:hypothetical protein
MDDSVGAYVHVLEAEIVELREENARLHNGLCLPRVNMTQGRFGNVCVYLSDKNTPPGQKRSLTHHAEYYDIAVVRGDVYMHEVGSRGTRRLVLHLCTEPGHETCYVPKYRIYADYESGLAVVEAIRTRKN